MWSKLTYDTAKTLFQFKLLFSVQLITFWSYILQGIANKNCKLYHAPLGYTGRKSNCEVLLRIIVDTFLLLFSSRSRELRAQKIKVPCGENTELKHSPFKAAVDQYPYMLHLLPGISSLLISTLPVHSPAFSQNFSQFCLYWLWLTHGFCVGQQNELGYPAGCRFPCRVPAEYKIYWLKKHALWYDDLWNE